MEIVILGDIQGGYGSQWVRIANTAGVKEIQIGDRFREQGFGPGSEELEVQGVNISPVGGASQVFCIRAANATQPMPHRLGAVFEQVGIKAVDSNFYQFSDGTVTASAAVSVTNQPTNGSASADAQVVPAPVRTSDEASQSEPLVTVISTTEDTTSTAPLMTPLKRKRGRPPGSKNKPKQEVSLPAGF